MISEPLLTYEPTIKERAEPFIRLYLRSKRSTQVRLKNTLVVAIIWAGMGYFVTHSEPTQLRLLYTFGALILGAIFGYLLHKPTVVHNTLKYIKSETSTEAPGSTAYLLSADRLICKSTELEISFSLTDLTAIEEDKTFLEFRFGKLGLCVVPLRVFSAEADKAHFIQQIKSAANR